MRKTCLYIFILALPNGCAPELNISRPCRNSEDCIQGIANYINEHVDGVDQINSDKKVIFNSLDNTLIVYVGESPVNFFNKWEISLTVVDPNSIEMDDTESNGYPITMTALNNDYLFKFYEDNEFVKYKRQFNYYPGATNGSKSRFRKIFVCAFKEAVEKSFNAA